MTNDIISQIAPTAAGLLETLTSFKDADFNRIPFEGSWTPGQLAEHVLKSVSGGLKAMQGPTKPADRNPEQNIPMLKSIFLNFDIKMQGPDFVQPTAIPKNQRVMTDSLKQTWDAIAAFAPANDMHLICSGAAMPNVGEMTRLEWLSFLVFHTQRHIHQLHNIAKHF